MRLLHYHTMEHIVIQHVIHGYQVALLILQMMVVLQEHVVTIQVHLVHNVQVGIHYVLVMDLIALIKHVQIIQHLHFHKQIAIIGYQLALIILVRVIVKQLELVVTILEL